MLSGLLFGVFLLGSTSIFYYKMSQIFQTINKSRKQPSTVSFCTRMKYVLLYALGQKKMFQKPLVATLHLIVYVGFFIVNIELIEIVFDGITGQHRSLSPLLGFDLYFALVNIYEAIAVLVIIACLCFLYRRNMMHISRFASPDLKGFPKRDGNWILIIEISLMLLFLSMNAAEYAHIQQAGGESNYMNVLPKSFHFSGVFVPFFQPFTAESLYVIERTLWWLHIVGILFFLNYLPYSKHLHIILGFIKAYRFHQTPSGAIGNIPSIQQEVRHMLHNHPSEVDSDTIYMGASDIHQLSSQNILDAFACTECGRCSHSCPAYITGKKLSPRKVMMSVRDRAEAWIRKIKKPSQAQRKLLHGYITPEELYACTTCQACVEACPILLNPLDIIIQLRRSLIMESSEMPTEWVDMLTNIENNASPWKYPKHERAKWSESL